MQEQLSYDVMSKKMGNYAKRLKDLIYEAAKDGINLAIIPTPVIGGQGAIVDEYLQQEYIPVKQSYSVPVALSRPLTKPWEMTDRYLSPHVTSHHSIPEDNVNMLAVFEPAPLAIEVTALKSVRESEEEGVIWWYKPYVEEKVEPKAQEQVVQQALVRSGFPLIPVIHQTNQQHFIPTSLVEPTEVFIEDERFFTSPLAFGQALDLLSISQTGNFIAKGLQDTTDCLDPNISLKNLYVKIGLRVFQINVENRPLTNAVLAGLNGFNTEFRISFDSILEINKDTPVVSIEKLNNPLEGNIHVSVEVLGTINLQLGIIELHSKAALKGFDSAVEKEPGVVDLLYTSINLIGYDLKAYRVNPNHISK